MSDYSRKFSGQNNKNTSRFSGLDLIHIDSLFDKATDALDDAKENLEELGDTVVTKATELKDDAVELGNKVVDGVKDAGAWTMDKANKAGEAIGEFGNSVKDSAVEAKDNVQNFFTSTVDGKDTKLFDFHPKKKGEFYLEDYADLDYSKYEKYYDSEEIVDYLDDLTVNTSLEIYNNQQTIDFYQKFLDAQHSEGWLNTNYIRLAEYEDLYLEWITSMDEKVHADWYAEPEKYATQIAYLESTREERMASHAGGCPPSMVDAVTLRATESEYRKIYDSKCTDEEMHNDPDFINLYNSFKEGWEGFKGSDSYAMENYGVTGDEYYYYYLDAQINGQTIINTLTNANYNMKQGMDMEPFEQIKLSEGFVNSDIDTKYDYATNYSFFMDDYNKPYTWNKEYLKETYGVESSEDWELLKQLNFMEDSDRELYFYLLNKDESLAKEFLDTHEDQINQTIACVKTLDELEASGVISYSKELEQQRLEAALEVDPNLNVKEFKNQCRCDTTCYEINTGVSVDIVNDYAKSLGFGFRDGLIQWGEGVGNAICADGIKSVKDYQRMYMVQVLSQGEGSRTLLNETYQFGTAAGNMLPSAAAGTAVTVATGGNAAAGSAVAKAMLVTSAYGNTKEQVMQTYEVSRGQAYLYAGASAGLELVMEGKLGSVLPLADKEAASFIEAFVKEGTQEAAQSLIESGITKLYFGEDTSLGDALTDAASEGIYGGLVGGTFYGGNIAIAPTLNTLMISNVAKQNSISFVEAQNLYQQYGIDYANENTKATFGNYVKENVAAKSAADINIETTTNDSNVSWIEEAEAANSNISNEVTSNVEMNSQVADINVETIDSSFTNTLNAIGESITSKLQAIKGVVTKVKNIDYSNSSALDSLRTTDINIDVSEMMQQIDTTKQQAESEGRFSIFHDSAITDSLANCSNETGANFLYEILSEYDEDCKIPYDAGMKLVELMHSDQNVFIHRTNAGTNTSEPGLQGNGILYSIMNDGLKNFGHAGVDYSNSTPDVSLTMTSMEGYTGYRNLLTNYKDSDVIVIGAFPESMVDNTGHITTSVDNVYNTGPNGENVIKPEYMQGVLVKKDSGLWEYYSRDEVLKQNTSNPATDISAMDSELDSDVITPIKVSDLNTELGMPREPFNMDFRYKGADYVYKANTKNITNVIKNIKQNNIEGNIIIEIDNTSGLTDDIINELPDNVEVLVVGGYTEETMNSMNGITTTATNINTIYTKEELLAINDKLVEIESNIESDWTDEYKIRYFYDYLNNNLNNISTMGEKNKHHGLLGLIDGTATYKGFAHIFNELCLRNNIYCKEIVGQNGMYFDYGFNLVEVNGLNYIVDTAREQVNGSNGCFLVGKDLQDYQAGKEFGMMVDYLKTVSYSMDDDGFSAYLLAKRRNSEINYEQIKNSSHYADFLAYYGDKISDNGYMFCEAPVDITSVQINMMDAFAILTNEKVFDRFMNFDYNQDYFGGINPLLYLTAMDSILQSANYPYSQEVYERFNAAVDKFSPLKTISGLPFVLSKADSVILDTFAGKNIVKVNYIDDVLFNHDGLFEEFNNKIRNLPRDEMLKVLASYSKLLNLYDEYVNNNPLGRRLDNVAVNRLHYLSDRFYSVVNRTNTVLSDFTKFGVDQACLSKLHPNSPQAKEVVNIFRSVFPDMSLRDARKLMKIINTKGVCSYAAAANAILMNFAFNTQEFRQLFGFNMFENINGNYLINDHLLLAKLFAAVNRDNTNLIEKQLFNYKMAKDDDKQMYMSSYSGFKHDLVNKFFDYYNIPYRCESTKFAHYDGYSDINDGLLVTYTEKSLNDKIMRVLAEGKQIQMSFFSNSNKPMDIILHGLNGVSDQKLSGDHAYGHSVFVTGIDENGNILISSWGKNYFLTWEEMKKVVFELDEISFYKTGGQ